ncbi:MAG TPA: phage tail tape measure protein, partial [Acidimicrobiia bacterium]
SEGNLKNMADVVEEFTRVLGPMSDAQAAVTLDQLGLTRSVGNNIRQLLGGADAIRDYEAALREAGGSTEEIAEKQLQSFNSQLDLLGSGFADIGITIGEALAGPLSRFVAWFQEQLPAIESFVNDAIPKVEEFVDRAVKKFGEFRTFFNENLREPLNEFKETLQGLGTIGLGEFEKLVERFKTFAPDFRAALDEGDPEEAGRLLGQFIANTFRSAFEAAGDITQPLADWAKSQDWGAIGMTVGNFAVEFLFGFYKGMFSDPATAQNEADRGSRTITQIFSDSLLNGIFAALVVSRIPIIGAPVRLLLRPLFAGFKKLGGAIFTRLVPFLGGLLWRAVLGAFSLLGRGIVSLGGMILSAIAGAFRAAFAAASSALAPLWQTLLITVRGAFRRWAFRFAGVAGTTIRTAIMALLKVGVKSLLKVVAGFVAAIAGWPAVLIAAIVAALAVFIIRFRNWFNSQEGEFENIGSAVVQFIIQGFQKMVGWFDRTVIGWFGDRWQGIKDWFADQQGDYENIGSRIIDGIVTGIKNAAGSLKDSLVNAARNAWNATKNFLGISSPSKLFEGIGMNMMEGMSRGISESAGIIQASVGVNSAMAANEARRFAEMAAAQRAEQQRAATPTTSAPINITVTSADPEAVVEALRRYTRNNGPLGQVVSLGQVAAV